MTLWFTRARLRRNAPVEALKNILLPDDESARTSVGHRLVWALFSDGPERERDFLWRETDPGVYFFLSERPPSDHHSIFELDDPKKFAPVLNSGDRLRFSLRANATRSKSTDNKVRGKPVDIVMDRLHKLPKSERPAVRRSQLNSIGFEWLARQGSRAGFNIAQEDCRVVGHRVLSLPRRGKNARLGVLDFEGVMTIERPEEFLSAIAKGFGRAKAFGNGLMLIRRV